jgi:hypothetical protein
MIKKIILFFSGWWKPIKNAKQYREIVEMLETELERTKALAETYEAKIEKADHVYTTIKSFSHEDGDKIFWPWVRQLISSDEYRYLIFLMRENTIREYTITENPIVISEINGKIKMLGEICIFLTQGLKAYDAKQKN